LRIWSFIQQKGGVGKTTLCLNLAVAAEAKGEKVLVVDLDQQGSAVFWSTTRATNKPTIIDALPEKLGDIIRAAPELGATLLLIDAPSRLDPVALAAIRAADLIICPTVPDLLNLAPLQETVALIESADKLAAAVGVLNNVDESGAAKKIEHAKGVLAAFKMAVAPTAIFHLPQFSAAYDRGKAVTELKPADGKAAVQIQALWSDLDKLARRIAAPKRNGKLARPAEADAAHAPARCTGGRLPGGAEPDEPQGPDDLAGRGGTPATQASGRRTGREPAGPHCGGDQPRAGEVREAHGGDVT
jgi:chromosome partitioning protein